MTKPFSLAFKQKMIERMSGMDAESARKVSRDTGISQEKGGRQTHRKARARTGAQGEGACRSGRIAGPQKKVEHLWEGEDEDTDEEKES